MNPFNNVLLIEDNPGDARLVAACLDERFGAACELRQARTLADGLRDLRREPADLVLLDLGLPDSQGLDGFLAVRRQSPRTPVVILTGDADERQALDALRNGAEDYLSKHNADSANLLRAMRHAVQRRQMTEQLRDSEARFRAIVETAEEGILQVDRAGAIVYLNARAAQLLGLPASGQALPPTVPAPGLRDGVQASHRQAFDALLRTAVGERSSSELPWCGPGGRPLWLIAAAGGMAARPDAPSGVVLLLTDITGRKLAEAELQRLKDALETRVAERTALLQTANQELRAISHAMAHDLRNPLSGIIGMAQLIRDEAQHLLPATAWKRLQLVQQSAAEMNELISRLLAQAAQDQQGIQREALDLSLMVQAISERLGAAEPDRLVSWHIQTGVQARGDRVLVADALRNLLDNAWKYSRTVPAARIEFGCEQPANKPEVYFVRDNGVGFDMADAGSLFEAFVRLPSASGQAGTGLGLASVKRIIAQHGGSLWATGTPGEGATVSFTLQASAAPA